MEKKDNSHKSTKKLDSNESNGGREEKIGVDDEIKLSVEVLCRCTTKPNSEADLGVNQSL